MWSAEENDSPCVFEDQRARQKLPPVWRHPVIDDAPRSAARAPADVLGIAVVAQEAAMPKVCGRVVRGASELVAIVFLRDAPIGSAWKYQ